MRLIWTRRRKKGAGERNGAEERKGKGQGAHGGRRATSVKVRVAFTNRRGKGKGKVGKGRKGEKQKRRQTVYMDDRTWANDDVDELLLGSKDWHEWSKEVGLLENPNKAQLTARTEEGRRKLKEKAEKGGMGHAVRDNVEILGLVTVAGRGKLVEKETKRIVAATKC